MNFVDDLVDRKINHFGFVSYFASMYSKCDRDRQAIIFREVNKSVFIHRFSKEITTKTLISWYCAIENLQQNYNDKPATTICSYKFNFIYFYLFIYLFEQCIETGMTNTEFHLKLPHEIEVEKESATQNHLYKEKRRRKEQKDHRKIGLLLSPKRWTLRKKHNYKFIHIK